MKYSTVYLLLVSFLALASLAKAEIPQPGITLPDQRVAVERSVHPWQAIGRVNKPDGGFCTGSLIGHDRVLTAAHCLWNPRTQDWLPASALHFVAGYHQGSYIGHSRVASYELDPARRHAGANIIAERDWAILTLATPMDPSIGTLPLAPPSAAFNRAGVTLAGYNRDRAHILSLHENCRFLPTHARLSIMLHDCDGTYGTSGAPLLVNYQGRPHIVAVHMGIATVSGRTVGVGISARLFRRHAAAH